MQAETLLQENDVEGTLLVLEELVEVTDHLETPTFPKDLNTTIDVVNQTLTQLVVDQDVNINDVSYIRRMHGTKILVLYVSFATMCQCDGIFFYRLWLYLM